MAAMSETENLANDIMKLIQQARATIECAESDILNDIETLCREFISAQHE